MDLVERLRNEGKDAFAKHYSLGTFKLCDEAATEIEKLQERVSDAEMDLIEARGSLDTAKFYAQMLEAALDLAAQKLGMKAADLVKESQH